MFHNIKPDINISSRVPNHINRNIDEGCSGNGAEIEILNINSPAYDTQDADEHDAAIDEAWKFIHKARRNEYNYHRRQMNNFHDEDEAETNLMQCRNHCFSTINQYLDTLENSSDEEPPNKTEKNCFSENELHDTISVYDETICAAAKEGPVFIYSYKNKKMYTPENSDLNSPDRDSRSSSTTSMSVENFNEDSMSYEKSFFRVASSYQPIIIPRLPLMYMLPTVAEILEPSRISPKVTEISYEDNAPKKKKSINSWVNNESSNSGKTNENNELNNSEEYSANKISSDHTKDQSHYSGEDSGKLKNLSLEKNSNVSKNNSNNNSKLGPEYGMDYCTNVFMTKQNQTTESDLDAIEFDSTCKDNFLKDTPEPKDSITYLNHITDFKSENSTIPTLQLSLNTETDSTKSWFKRFIKCIWCCK